MGLVLLDVLFLGIVVGINLGVFDGDMRRTFVGVLCATFTVAMYAAPLSAVVRFSNIYDQYEIIDLYQKEVLNYM